MCIGSYKDRHFATSNKQLTYWKHETHRNVNRKDKANRKDIVIKESPNAHQKCDPEPIESSLTWVLIYFILAI